jgi:hypothetical protein
MGRWNFMQLTFPLFVAIPSSIPHEAGGMRHFHFNRAAFHPHNFFHQFKDKTFSERCRLLVIYNNTPFKNKYAIEK